MRRIVGKKPGVVEEWGGGAFLCVWGVGGSLRVPGGGAVGDALAKHRCLVVWSDPPPRRVHRRLISSSTEQGEQRGAGCPPRLTSSPPPLIGLGLTWFPEGHRVLVVVGWSRGAR